MKLGARRLKYPVPGDVFGRLTVLKELPRVNYITPYECRCSCGALTSVNVYSLLKGKTSSCGCLHLETVKVIRLKHGMARTPTYKVWAGMVHRCGNPKAIGYKDYGGRGIKVCVRWLKFENFFADMGIKPYRMEIDRRDNDGNYEPGNCQWATRIENSNNTRKSVRVTYKGKTQTLSQWAHEYGLSPNFVGNRYRKQGWDIEKCLTHPGRYVGSPLAALTKEN